MCIWIWVWIWVAIVFDGDRYFFRMAIAIGKIFPRHFERELFLPSRFCPFQS